MLFLAVHTSAKAAFGTKKVVKNKVNSISANVKTVCVVSYYDDGDAPVVTVFDDNLAAERCYTWFLNTGGHTKVDIDEVPIYHSFTVNGK